MPRLKLPKARAFLLVLSSPSGGGKTTICHELLKLHPELKRCVTATTRAPRPGEEQGKDYLFLSQEEFERTVREGGFYEHALVHGNYYGTPKSTVDACLKRGQSLVLVIDVQGGATVKKKRPDAVLVFLMPPSLAELKKRLVGRATDAAEVIRRRLKEAENEIKAAQQYDYLVINDDLQHAVSQVSSVFVAETLRQSHSLLLENFKDLDQ